MPASDEVVQAITAYLTQHKHLSPDSAVKAKPLLDYLEALQGEGKLESNAKRKSLAVYLSQIANNDIFDIKSGLKGYWLATSPPGPDEKPIDVAEVEVTGGRHIRLIEKDLYPLMAL